MVRTQVGFVVALAVGGCAVELDELGESSSEIKNAPATTLNEWSVMIISKVGDARSLCSASILSPHWIMTAAHCVDHGPTHVEVWKNGLVYNDTAQFFIHPDYGGSSIVGTSDTDDDLALIELGGGGLGLTEHARIGLPALQLGETITVVASGRGSDPGSYPDCEDAGYGTKRIAEYSLKTLEWEKLEIDWGDQEVCGGDSGAPWSVPIDGRHAVVGVMANKRVYHDADACALRAKLPWIDTFSAGLAQGLACPEYNGASRHFAECFEPPQAVTAMSTGREHACAVHADMTVRCWGRGTEGQLGTTSLTNSAKPRKADLGPMTGVAAGDRHTCALTPFGTVTCFGDGSLGQRGDSTYSSGFTRGAVVLDNGNPLSGVVSISSGGYHSCAVTSSGLAYCWGYNAFGQLGNGTTTTSPVARPVGSVVYVPGSSGKGGAPSPGYYIFNPLTNVVRLDAGAYHTCASLTDGKAYCWGYNGWGQLGDGTYTQRTSPTRVWNLTGVTSISAGMTTTCAARSSEPRSACWGSPASGQFGDGGYNASLIPRYAYLYMSGAVEVAVGLSHVCYGSNVDNRSKCAGSNAHGALGIWSGSTPWFTQNYALNVKALDAGENFSCWLADRGYVSCAGYNGQGQLGQPSLASSSFPYAVQALNVPPWQ